MGRYFLLIVFLLNIQWVDAAMMHKSFAPENNEWEPVRYDKDAELKGVTEKEFHEVIDLAVKIYEPIFEELGFEFNLIRDWNNGTVNAYAQQIGNLAIVRMFGGLARREEVSPMGFLGVVCHEIGHHLGGAPKKNGMWPSNEGQSDFFSTQRCLKRILAVKPKGFRQLKTSKDDKRGYKKCWRSYKGKKNKAKRMVCWRSIRAGKSLATLLAHLRGKGDPKFKTPDKTVVSATNNNHPNAQCRLDTYLQGALCPLGYKEELDDEDYRVGTCHREKFKKGNRPLCWFKPESDE